MEVDMFYYTSERNAQIVISLLKAHGIKKVIASPGTTSICLVSSMQRDPFFEMYSAPEERSAAYMACGLAVESGEPVVITCTGATASRNYFSGLTEAFYRKIPVLAITCSRRNSRIGHNFDQVTDRTQLPKDVAKLSVQVPVVLDDEIEWADTIAVNKALLELTHHSKGPVHINLETEYSTDYSVKNLPPTRVIRRISGNDEFPPLPAGRIVIFVGSHDRWSAELTEAVDDFCSACNAVVLSDLLGNYKGKFGIPANLTAQQSYRKSVLLEHDDLVIHLGNVHAPAFPFNVSSVWRVNPDGELRDTFRKLEYVFEMEEVDFFRHYADLQDKKVHNDSLFELCRAEEEQCYSELKSKVGELPFSNAWIASQTAERLPENSVIHFGIQNSLRFWNFFHVPQSVCCYCNTGGFGIDGSISSAIGASLANPDRLYYCVLGDLAFFYDLNSLGNRHVGKNLRIILINNGKGTEFKLTGNPGHLFGQATDEFIAAAGHYGNKSHSLVKHFAEDLGFKYFGVSNKQEYLQIRDEVVSPGCSAQSILVEVFTNSEDEDSALKFLHEICMSAAGTVTKKAKETIKEVIGNETIAALRRMMGK